jgi:hypothetical protein
MKMGIPLNKVSCRSERDDDARKDAAPEHGAEELLESLRACLDQIQQQLATFAKEWPQKTGECQHDVAVVHGSEKFGAQPF